MNEKVAIFIDGANLFNGLRQDFNRIDLDYEKLVEKLLKERTLSRVYFYTALPDQSRDPERYQKQQKFIAALKNKPYFNVTLGRLELRENNTYVEKGVDIALAVDMVDLGYLNTYDTAILISGDGDFYKAVESVKRLGKHVENAITKSCMSYNLRQTCDISIVLDHKFLSDCWM